jgi:hypothetical protein
MKKSDALIFQNDHTFVTPKGNEYHLDSYEKVGGKTYYSYIWSNCPEIVKLVTTNGIRVDKEVDATFIDKWIEDLMKIVEKESGEIKNDRMKLTYEDCEQYLNKKINVEIIYYYDKRSSVAEEHKTRKIKFKTKDDFIQWANKNVYSKPKSLYSASFLIANRFGILFIYER